jgi:acetoin utilization deacetylase AcuC-like enzyme
VSLLLITDGLFLEHEAGPAHPERPDRLRAVWSGIEDAGLGSDLVTASPSPATLDEVLTAHDPELVEQLERMDAGGGGRIDADTAMGARSWPAARLAAGAGLTAVAELTDGVAGSAFCAVRPPGHHATRSRSMGFCLLNNVAVAASQLVGRGERVLIVDYDAHHGNGTQAIFEGDPRVMYVSFHQWPLYPGSGAIDEQGVGEGLGTTLNVPFPAGTTGDRYRQAWEAIAETVSRFAPTWLVISAGFDAHRADPLTDLGLSSGDFADLTADILATVPHAPAIAMLEGGYDLGALRTSAAAVARALVGDPVHPEPPTRGGPGADVVEQVARACRELAT